MTTEKKNPSGCELFAQLCAELESSYPYLYPVVTRYRSSGWVVEIYARQKNAGGKPLWHERLASGYMDTMDAAMLQCVSNFLATYLIFGDPPVSLDRIQELLKDPKVQEALVLFGYKIEDEK